MQKYFIFFVAGTIAGLGTASAANTLSHTNVVPLGATRAAPAMVAPHNSFAAAERTSAINPKVLGARAMAAPHNSFAAAERISAINPKVLGARAMAAPHNSFAAAERTSAINPKVLGARAMAAPHNSFAAVEQTSATNPKVLGARVVVAPHGLKSAGHGLVASIKGTETNQPQLNSRIHSLVPHQALRAAPKHRRYHSERRY